MNFESLKLPPRLHKALQAMRFETPTPIQAQAIPPALEGRDLIACAQTGTGKTAAFGVPSVARLMATPSGKDASNMLVLVPTRELAQQVADVLSALTQFTPELKVAVIIGGAAMHKQVRALAAKPRIVIATPGRLCDHLQQKTASLAHTHTFVLDEADRMLDMGFAPQLSQIMRHLPKQRQTLLFSATLPPEIEALARQMLHNPERIAVGAVSRPIEKIEQSTVHATGQTKNDVLLDQINARQGSIIIFTRTKHRTDRVARYLTQYGLAVARLHGDRTQGQRNRAMDGFRSGEFRIMVCTDIAARGIDISHIAHVINYDLPQVPEDYVHRIGRTARAGAEGQAVSILVPEDREMWGRIQKLINPRFDPRAMGPIGAAGGAGGSNPRAQAAKPAQGAKPQPGGAPRPSGRRRRRRR